MRPFHAPRRRDRAKTQHFLMLVALCATPGCFEEETTTAVDPPAPQASPSPTPTPTPTASATPAVLYRVGGSLSGSNGQVVVAVTDANGINPLTLTQNGNFRLPDSYAAGESYAVAVMASPPHQACTIMDGPGVVAHADVDTIAISCVNTNTLNLSVAVTGITTNDVLSVTYGGSTVQATGQPIAEYLDPNTAYDVTLVPLAGYLCSAQSNNLTGTIGNDDVEIHVACAKQAYAVTFTATGLTGQDTLHVVDTTGTRNDVVLTPGAASQAWAHDVGYGDGLALSLTSGNAHLICTFAHQATTLAASMTPSALSVPITCGHAYDASGTVSGMYAGASMTLGLNGNTQVVHANAPTFVFSNGIIGGSDWNLTTVVQPANQRCTPNPNAGVAIAGDLTGIVVTCVPYLTFSQQQNASVVIGQADFAGNMAGDGTTGSTWGQAYASPIITPGGGLAINDSQFGKSLFYNAVPTHNGAGADRMLAGNGNIPSGIAADSNHFLVMNVSLNTINVTQTYPPVGVNPNFTLGGTGGCGAAAMRTPSDIWLANGMLAVSDVQANRVLFWRSIPTVQNQPADAVLGQADFNTCTAPSAVTASSMRHAQTVWFNTSMIMAGSSQDTRVSIWFTGPQNITNGQTPDVVLGAPDKVTAGTGAATQGSFSPWKIISNGTQIFVVDANNNRILIWNSIPHVDGAPADVVLGQPNFTTNATNASAVDAWTLNHPYGAAVNATSLIINDHANYRMLVFTGQ